jgi:hypothetical protein
MQPLQSRKQGKKLLDGGNQLSQLGGVPWKSGRGDDLSRPEQRSRTGQKMDGGHECRGRKLKLFRVGATVMPQGYYFKVSWPLCTPGTRRRGPSTKLSRYSISQRKKGIRKIALSPSSALVGTWGRRHGQRLERTRQEAGRREAVRAGALRRGPVRRWAGKVQRRTKSGMT